MKRLVDLLILVILLVMVLISQTIATQTLIEDNGELVVINTSLSGKIEKVQAMPEPITYQLSTFMPNMMLLQCLDSFKDVIFNRGLIVEYTTGIWTKIQFSKLELSKDDDTFSTKNASIVVGCDACVDNDLLLGILLESKKYWVKQNKSSGVLNKISAGIYSCFIRDNYDIKLSFLGNINCYNLSRVNALNETYNSDFQGLSGNVDVETGYKIRVLEHLDSNTFIKPYGGISFALAHTDNFQETGQQYNTLNVNMKNFNRLLLHYGIKFGGNKKSFKWDAQVGLGNVLEGRTVSLECKRISTKEDVNVESINPGGFVKDASLGMSFNILKEMELFCGTKVSKLENLTSIDGNLSVKYKF
jgi:hypothetical protein